jgi:N-acetylmuramoyl-L-alanine amidase
MEKTYTLDVAQRLKQLLEAKGYKVVMTRESDVDRPEKQIRSEIANQASADLFVSIHFNSLYPNTKTTGVEVLTFPPRPQRSTDSWSPGQEGRFRGQGGPHQRVQRMEHRSCQQHASAAPGCASLGRPGREA